MALMKFSCRSSKSTAYGLAGGLVLFGTTLKLHETCADALVLENMLLCPIIACAFTMVCAVRYLRHMKRRRELVWSLG